MKDFLKFIKSKLTKNLKIEKIEIIDNSKKHEKHKFFDVKKHHLCLNIESQYLKSLSKIDAQRKIMKILSNELKDRIHALEINIR
ncbi:BolA/IbaG family iron-sulfur metabolism protein [Pelagibacteraceae bacterium]|nr:BolA/IbaG family iron-sulfur metabolism protein [Pelagibacteraceae bacterium]